jgi:hypothetical protein
MPDATITSTASTFGTISGTFAADQSTVTGTITGIITGTLSGSVGVPGPAGAPGVGVPAGGTAGQFLTKIDGTNYNTDWTTVNLTGLATESWVTAGFYPLTGNPSGFLTSAPVTSVAGRTGAIILSNTDISGLGTLAVVNDAPSDGSQYARKNGAWDVVTTAPDFISSVSSPLAVTTGNLTIDLSAYAQLSGATFTGNVFAPTPSPGTDSTRIATTEWVKDLDYAPLNSPQFNGNPRGPTPSLSDNDTSLATTEFVKGQNYITSSALTPYLTSATAASTYAPIASPSFTGLATFDNPSNFAITVPNGASDYTSISAGVYSLVLSGTETIRLSGAGIKYPDGVTQTVAYPGPSGFLLKADNLSGLANTSTARTNLGLGTMATATAADYSTTTAANGLYYPLSSNPAGYLTTAPVTSVAGKTGAVTLAVADVSGAAPLASPTFTGTPSLPTGTIGVTQTAGNNTTALATTSFVTAAVPAFATLAESIGGAVTNKIVAPDDAEFLVTNSDLLPINRPFLTGVTSGGGASAFATGFTSYVNAPNGGAGHAVLKTFGTSQSDQLFAFWNSTGYYGINYSKRIHLSGRCAIDPLTDTNITALVTFGKLSADAPGDLVRKGIGWKYRLGGGANYLNLIVHNGTSQTAVATTFQQSSGIPFSWDIVSDGSGGVKLYINGVERASTSSGPTGTMTSNTPCYTEEIVAAAAAAVSYQRLTTTRGFIYVQTK